MILGLVDALASRNEGWQGALVHLLGRPYVSQKPRSWDIAEGGKRLLVFLALHRQQVERRYVAGCLWPLVDDERAAGNLRSALWRLNSIDVPLVLAEPSCLRLRTEVQVDVHLLGDWAARVIAGSHEPTDMAVMPWDLERLEMLPGWYDDWVLVERERLRQRLLHAMENVSREMTRMGRCAEAIEIALLVVSSDPLRESSQRVLIEAHLAEGNWAEAQRRLETYRRLLNRELGVQPSPHLANLLETRKHGHHVPASGRSLV